MKKHCKDNDIEYKALLLLDNTPAHPSEEVLKSRDGKVVAMFLPPNTTVIQLTDQGILVGLKKRYKKILLRHLILKDQSSSLSVPDVLKQLTIKDAIYWSAKAWDEITVENLKRGWNQLFSSCGVSGNTTTSGIDNHTEISIGPSCSTSTSDTTTSTVPSITTTESIDNVFDVDTNNANFYEIFNS